jgi:XrtJ-associated TM-motif-TM protein
MQRKNIPMLLLTAVALFALTTKAAFGYIGGCVDSPEDPTAVLAVLGCSAAAIPILRSRIRARKRNR